MPTGQSSCRRPDKVIDVQQLGISNVSSFATNPVLWLPLVMRDREDSEETRFQGSVQQRVRKPRQDEATNGPPNLRRCFWVLCQKECRMPHFFEEL